MSRAIHFVTQNVPGYGLADGRFLPCSGVSGRTVSFSPCYSSEPYKILSHFKTAALRCTSRVMIPGCYYRKNPDFSRQNKGGFSGNKNNRQNDGGEGFPIPEESDDMFSSKNGAVPSTSKPPKYQATSNPGPREKEIVEMFKQIQTELREKAAIQRERKKTELRQPRGKGDEHVDSLLEILRKHTTERKTSSSSSGGNRDFIVDDPKSGSLLENERRTPDFMLEQSERNGAFVREESTTSLDLNNNVKGEAQGHEPESPTFSKQVSNFQRRSSVPLVKYQPIRSDSFTDTSTNGKNERIHPNTEFSDPSIDGILEEKSSDIVKGEAQGHAPESSTISRPISNFQRRSPVPQVKCQPLRSDSVTDTWIDGKSERIHPDTEIDDPRIDGMLEEKHFDVDEGYSDDEVEEEKPITDEGLRAMKLLELRALAKSRGLKGFSKLKKSVLLELLSGGST